MKFGIAAFALMLAILDLMTKKHVISEIEGKRIFVEAATLLERLRPKLKSSEIAESVEILQDAIAGNDAEGI